MVSPLPLGYQRELRLKQPADLRFPKSVFLKLADELVNILLRLLQAASLFRLTFKVDDKCTGAVPYLDDAFVFQFPVGLDNCCWAQDKVLSQSSDTGKLIARHEGANVDGVLDLLNQLQIERNTGGRIEAKKVKSHCT